MLETSGVVTNIAEVPREWVFEFYLELDTELTGQDIQISSVFKTENTPSMFIYFNKQSQRYLYKDYSSDHQGDGVDLVLNLFGLLYRAEAAQKITDDYNNFVISNPIAYMERVIGEYEKYKVTDYTERNWNTDDKTYWTQFKIGSSALTEYCIKPLACYRLSKTNDGKAKELIIKGTHIYGYFKQNGSLYKIYQPKNRKNKFIRILSYIQGSEQLTFRKDYLILNASLKDLLAFNTLKFSNAESVAPESESVIIPLETIDFYKMHYKAIIAIFDNDEAGIRAMERYKEEYNIPGLILFTEQDMAKSIQEHGPDNIRIIITPLLKQSIDEYKNLLRY